MKAVVGTDDFVRDLATLSGKRRQILAETVLSLSDRLGYASAADGARKLHPSGIWEITLGLGISLLYLVDKESITLVRAAAPAEIERYLRTL